MSKSNSHLSFRAKVEKVMGEGGWHIVLLPDDITTKLREDTGKKGNVPVVVTIGKSTYPTTIMSMGDQRWFVAIKAAIRKAENIQSGDTVQVYIAPDFDRLS